MAKILVVLIMLASYQGHSGDMVWQFSSPRKLDVVKALALAAVTISLAEELSLSADAHQSPEKPVLATLYFVYVSSWLGNVYGFFDIIGWFLDWLSNWVFYRKGDSVEVVKLKDEIEQLKSRQRKKYLLAAQLCLATIKSIKTDKRDMIPEMLECIKQSVEYRDDKEEQNSKNDYQPEEDDG